LFGAIDDLPTIRDHNRGNTSMQVDPIILAKISEEAGVKGGQAQATISLLEEQATVPFIARYRKEATGNLDEVAIRTISERLEYYKELLARRETILKSIEEQGKLTEELKSRIQDCYGKNELEDLYLPYKPKRKTKASVAIERGLEPLARFIWDQVPGEKSIEELADSFINQEKEVLTRELALEGALHIVAEWMAEDAEIRRQIRELMMKEGWVVSKVVKGKEAEKSKFEMYYDFKEPVSKIPSHRMLAIRRGVKEQLLSFTIEVESAKAIQLLTQRFLKDANTPFASYWMTAIQDGYDRLLNPSLQSEVRSQLKESSDLEAIKVFEANLDKLLLSPPAGAIVVLGIDPGFRTGCKLAVVDETGKFLDHATIFPTEPRKNIVAAERTLYNLVVKYKVKAIDIGNGTASRESDAFVREFLRKYNQGEPFEFEKKGNADTQSVRASSSPDKDSTVHPPDSEPQPSAGISVSVDPASPVVEPQEAPALTQSIGAEVPSTDPLQSMEDISIEKGSPASTIEPAEAKTEVVAIQPIAETPVQSERQPVFSVTVNESGASVYSASDVARREFPDLDVTVRGAISIARRLQDPLAELVKIHPKSIGVGQYQHDVDQNQLREGLEATVESCVNRVGVDLNTASQELLKYVSGLNQRTAKRIVEHRNQNGPFRSRQQLLEVSGFGVKTFEQAAGFLRIKGGENPLDATAVHPESYSVVEQISQALVMATAELIGNTRVLENLDLKSFVNEKTGEFTLHDIKEELLKPGRDPRSQFVVPTFREDVREVSDLKEGMELEGTVTNVTNFGAFVDIGVHQDGLVHVSELSNRFVQDPRTAVQVGQIVKVKVIGVDLTMKRISLSIKALLPKIKKNRIRKTRKPAHKPQVSPLAVEAPAATSTAEQHKPRDSRPPSSGTRRPQQPPRSAAPYKKEVPSKTVAERAPQPKREISPTPVNQSLADKIRLLQEKFGGIR
jgi:protein Tex